MDGSDLAIIDRGGGVADGVQNAYADALKGVRSDAMRPPPSIGYQCPVYAPGMGPAPMSSGDMTVDVGGKRIHD